MHIYFAAIEGESSMLWKSNLEDSLWKPKEDLCQFFLLPRCFLLGDPLF